MKKADLSNQHQKGRTAFLVETFSRKLKIAEVEKKSADSHVLSLS
jgi:hypothetical protein